jgi:hypothetical protein
MIAKMVHERPAAVTRFGRQLMMVKAVSDEALAPAMVLTAVLDTGGPPPSSNSEREALVQWVDAASFGGNGG